MEYNAFQCTAMQSASIDLPTMKTLSHQPKEDPQAHSSAHRDQTQSTSCVPDLTQRKKIEEENEEAKDENAFEPYLPGDPIPNKKKFAIQQVVALGLLMLIDVGIPLALYYGLRNVIDVLYALIIAGVPPFLWVVWGFIWKRRIDALGCIIGLSFILSGVVSIISGTYAGWLEGGARVNG